MAKSPKATETKSTTKKPVQVKTRADKLLGKEKLQSVIGKGEKLEVISDRTVKKISTSHVARARSLEQKRQAKEAGYALNLFDLSVAIGLTIPILKAYMSRGMPYTVEGYDIEECKEWIEKFKKDHGIEKKFPLLKEILNTNRDRDDSAIERAASSDDKTVLQRLKTKAETRKLIQEARGKKLKNDEYEGLLLPADDVRQWIASRLLRIKQRLETLPDELQMLAPSEIRPQLRMDLSSAIHELLLEMSGWQMHIEYAKAFTEEGAD